MLIGMNWIDRKGGEILEFERSFEGECVPPIGAKFNYWVDRDTQLRGVVKDVEWEYLDSTPTSRDRYQAGVTVELKVLEYLSTEYYGSRFDLYNREKAC